MLPGNCPLKPKIFSTVIEKLRRLADFPSPYGSSDSLERQFEDLWDVLVLAEFFAGELDGDIHNHSEQG